MIDVEKLDSIKNRCKKIFDNDNGEFEKIRDLLSTPDGEREFVAAMVQALIDEFYFVGNDTFEKILRATLEIVMDKKSFDKDFLQWYKFSILDQNVKKALKGE